MATQVVDEDGDMDCDDWKLVMRQEKEAGPHKYASKRNNRQLEENISDKGNRAVRMWVDREEFKITLKFRMEDEQVKLSP